MHRAIYPFPSNTPQARYLLGAIFLATVLMLRNWVGYDGADDLSYALAAEDWIRHFPALGTNHWALRYTIVLPVAASLRIFGQHEWALCLPNAAFFIGLIGVNHHFASRLLGAQAGGLLAILLAVTPEFIVQATYINLDLVEVFFASFSFWLLMWGIAAAPGKYATFLTSGILAGIAFLTRETSCVLVVLSVVGYFYCPVSKRHAYSFFWAGLILVLGIEAIYFWHAAGDPLYRYNLDAHHDNVDRALLVQQTEKGGKVIDKEGALSVNVLLNPILMMFGSQKYGILFYLALPMSIWLYQLKFSAQAERKVFLLACWISVLWIGFISMASFILYLVPRYFVVPAWSCTIIIAMALNHLWLVGRRKMVAIIAAALLLTNALSLYLENETPRFAERSLTQYLLAHHQASVHVDPDTWRRISLIAEFAGVSTQLVTGPSKKGELFFYSPRNLELCAPQELCKQFAPGTNWKKVVSFQQKPRAIGGVIRRLHLASFIHPQIMQKIEQPSPGAAIYLVAD